MPETCDDTLRKQQNRFRPGLHPDPAGELTTLPSRLWMGKPSPHSPFPFPSTSSASRFSASLTLRLNHTQPSSPLCYKSGHGPAAICHSPHHRPVLHMLFLVTTAKVTRVLSSSPAKFSSTTDIIPTSLLPLRCKGVFSEIIAHLAKWGSGDVLPSNMLHSSQAVVLAHVQHHQFRQLMSRSLMSQTAVSGGLSSSQGDWLLASGASSQCQA